MSKKTFQHFKEPALLYEILEEIKKRHPYGYEGLLKKIIDGISEYYNSIVNFQAQYDNTPKFLIGLSGGIDSALVTYLAVTAVGKENVFPLTMPVRDEEKESLLNAALIRAELGIELHNFPYVISIKNIVEQQIATINMLNCNFLTIETDINSQTIDDKIRIGNLASRTRINILYDFARKLNGRVLGTGNKIELMQGFAAKYGTPFSCDFNVLYELYKVDIYELARLLNIPQQIINAIPTTGYYSGQTHESELGATLEEQDAIIYLLFDKHVDPTDIEKEYKVNPKFINIIINRYKNSLHKRMLKQKYIKINY